MSGHPNSLCTVLCAAVLNTCVKYVLYLPIDPSPLLMAFAQPVVLQRLGSERLVYVHFSDHQCLSYYIWQYHKQHS